MPLGYHINTDDGLITVQGEGPVEITELAELGHSLLGDGRYDPALPQLLDFRGLRPNLDGVDEEAELARLRSFVQDRYRDRVAANVAVVIDDHLESRHCADIYLITCAIDEAELFADYDQALKWLMRQAFAEDPAPAMGADDTVTLRRSGRSPNSEPQG